MTANVVHTGKKSWWDGRLKTDCGLRLDGDSVVRHGFLDWLFGVGTECPACRRARGEG